MKFPLQAALPVGSAIALCVMLAGTASSSRSLRATPTAVERAVAVPCNHDDPLPAERTNCVRCHLTAGRELTTPVRDFARSVHDYAAMSCDDCHGGNSDDDILAHEPEFEFIGTKLSAHMAACADCHVEEAREFRGGPHYWDLTQRINRDYPVCIDCHGNHDVGKPPAEFALGQVCRDCHKAFDDVMPELDAMVAENDRLWELLRRVQAQGSSDRRFPAEFERAVAELRRATARVMHRSARIEPHKAESLNRRSRELRERLTAWLEATRPPQPAERGDGSGTAAAPAGP